MRKIGIIVFQGISILAFFAGIIQFLNASGIPSNYYLRSASAVQITQVYSEANFIMLQAIAYILIGLFIQVALYVGYPTKNPQTETISKDIAAIKIMLARIANLINQKRQ